MSFKFAKLPDATESESEHAYDDMNNLARGLEMDDAATILRPAVAFYTIALERNFTRGRRRELVEAACLHCLLRGQESALVQHAEECRLAEENIQKLESEVESLLSRKSEMELLLSNSQEKINTLSESSRLSESKMQDLLKSSVLESESKVSKSY
ncbi:hypothetical protein U1Q18_022413 [Sarracenia purpurea var. burkii]